jgi:hypothetical protein
MEKKNISGNTVYFKPSEEHCNAKVRKMKEQLPGH